MFSIGLSIIYDFIFLFIAIPAWWQDQKWDGQIEQGLRQFSIVMTGVLIIVKILLFIIYWHTSVQYYDLVEPIKERIRYLRRQEYLDYKRRYRNALQGGHMIDDPNFRNDFLGGMFGGDQFDQRDQFKGFEVEPGMLPPRASRRSRKSQWAPQRNLFRTKERYKKRDAPPQANVNRDNFNDDDDDDDDSIAGGHVVDGTEARK